MDNKQIAALVGIPLLFVAYRLRERVKMSRALQTMYDIPAIKGEMLKNRRGAIEAAFILQVANEEAHPTLEAYQSRYQLINTNKDLFAKEKATAVKRIVPLLGLRGAKKSMEKMFENFCAGEYPLKPKDKGGFLNVNGLRCMPTSIVDKDSYMVDVDGIIDVTPDELTQYMKLYYT